MTLEELNRLPEQEAVSALLRCCTCTRWASQLISRRPFESLTALKEASDKIWQGLSDTDWKEAFAGHPKIGEAPGKRSQASADWAKQEQAGTASASEEILRSLAEENKRYESRFGYIFIVFATGKSSKEMLGILRQRLQNDPAREILIAAEEQRKITNLRLEKLLT